MQTSWQKDICPGPVHAAEYDRRSASDIKRRGSATAAVSYTGLQGTQAGLRT